MRPTPEGVGNTTPEDLVTGPIRCFNEAHARRRGKLHDHVVHIRVPFELQ